MNSVSFCFGIVIDILIVWPTFGFFPLGYFGFTIVEISLPVELLNSDQSPKTRSGFLVFSKPNKIFIFLSSHKKETSFLHLSTSFYLYHRFDVAVERMTMKQFDCSTKLNKQYFIKIIVLFCCFVLNLHCVRIYFL